MSWHGIHGHDEVVERFRVAMARGRLASSFLFAGPPGIGKRTFAVKLAQAWLCRVQPAAAIDPCEACPDCAQVRAGTHPDIEIVAKPPDKSFIPLELLIGDKEHRMREGLCHNLSLKPMSGRRKIAVIDDADFLNPEGANSLLKTLEEPPAHSCLILIGTSPARQLPTIRSRCQLIRFRPLDEEIVAQLLLTQEIVADAPAAERLARHADGSLARAAELADPALWEFRAQFYERLADPVLENVALAKTVLAFVDEAGTTPAARRARLRQVIAFAADFYRQLQRTLAGLKAADDAELHRAAAAAAERWRQDDSAVAAALDRSLQAAEQVDRNAYQPLIVDAWLTDLARIAATGGVGAEL